MIRPAMIALSLVTVAASAASAQQQSLIERGSYLVNGVLTCGNCHTPRAKGGVFDKAKAFSGGPQVFEGEAFTVKGSNITPHRTTGIGEWSEADIKRALTEGRRPNGVQLAPAMPYAFYKVFTTRDLDAVVAYLRSLPPVENQVQTPVYNAAFHSDIPPGAEKQMIEAEMKDPVRRGFYLVTIGHCMECHSPEVGDHRADFSNLGKGGREFKGPWGVTVSRNITSHKTAGLGAWSDAEIKNAITKGVRKDGTQLRPPMAFDLYASMTDDDLSAIVAYLRTVPPKE
jgi:mono/diheme cytochrome c family protein